MLHGSSSNVIDRHLASVIDLAHICACSCYFESEMAVRLLNSDPVQPQENAMNSIGASFGSDWAGGEQGACASCWAAAAGGGQLVPAYWPAPPSTPNARRLDCLLLTLFQSQDLGSVFVLLHWHEQHGGHADVSKSGTQGASHCGHEALQHRARHPTNNWLDSSRSLYPSFALNTFSL